LEFRLQAVGADRVNAELRTLGKKLVAVIGGGRISPHNPERLAAKVVHALHRSKQQISGDVP